MKDTLILQVETAKWALHQNLEGLSQEDSLLSPKKGGNSVNWLVGHLVTAYGDFLQGVGEESSYASEQLSPYKRGSGPLDPAKARPLSELLAAFDQFHAQVVAKVIALSPEELAAPAAGSPRNDPNETVGSLLGLIAFHQSYHVGQTGVLRRVIGKEGAIA